MIESGVKILGLDIIEDLDGVYFPVETVAEGTKRVSWDTLKADPDIPQTEEYRIWEHLITDSIQKEIEIWRPGYDQAIMRLGPENDWVDTDTTSYPKESTLTLYLSRKRWYDCFADISLNRLDPEYPDNPNFVIFLRGDGIRVPNFMVQSRKDSGDYETLIECDPDGDDHRFKSLRGSVVCKMSEAGSIDGLYNIEDSGPYYVDGTLSGLPWAENGSLDVRINPYSSSEGQQLYQSFINTAHRAVRALSAGVWSAWRTL